MKKRIHILMIFIITAFLFIPFINVKADNDSRVQIIHPYGGGTFTISGGNYDGTENFDSTKSDFFEIGETITLTAHPSEGHGLAGWFVATEEEGEHPGEMIWVPGTNLSGLTTYTFTVEDPYYNIMPVFELQISCSGSVGHNNIWSTEGGSVAVLYNKIGLDGTKYTSGEVVDYCVGDEITVYAQAGEDKHFVGWYVSNVQQGPQYYYNDAFVSEEAEYTYKPGVTTVEGIDEPINYITAVFEDGSGELIDYTLDADDGNQIIMKDIEGRILVFNSTEIMGLTDEQLAEIAEIEGTDVETIKAMLAEVISKVKTATEGKGALLKIYEFSISDGSPEPIHEAPGGFKIRLKITDDMKGYDTYTLYYLDDDYKIQDTIVLTKNGDYFEGILPHLSGYVLMGSMNNSNPDTGDNILLYISILGISVIGLVGLGIYTKKRNFN